MTEPTESPTGRILLTRDQTKVWVEAAQESRLSDQVLRGLGAPKEQSALWFTDQMAPAYPASVWCRSFLNAAIEHMLMWADYAAPLKFHEEAETVHRLRPALTLARAAIESAAQALWVLSASGLLERASRHVSLVLWDLSQQSKAAMTQEAKDEIKAARAALLASINREEKDFPEPQYLNIIKAAAAFSQKGAPNDPLDAAHVERVWRSSAGAAHGKRWTAIEHMTDMESGGVTYTVPNPESMSAALEIASTFVSFGVFQYADRLGRLDEWKPMWDAAMVDLKGRITLRDDLPEGPSERV